jgi:hypothetical protein
LAKPVTVMGLVEPVLTMGVDVPVLHETVYSVMLDPPVDVGAVKDTKALLVPSKTVTPEGAPGVEVTLLTTAVEDAEDPL